MPLDLIQTELGKDRSELIGRSLLSLLPESEQEEYNQNVEKLVNGRQKLVLEHSVAMSNGTKGWKCIF